MSITVQPFGQTPDGQAVTRYTLTNHSGASISVIDWGAILTSIIVPDKDGRTWYEADCYYTEGNRNACRIVFSSDGLIYYTDDHYATFTQMFPSGE